mmetsp:Transcript_12103/g.32049  ORF Transcript_12103/g.32049 Transcript_12103/m.32049 type:complete len:250 (+) Transcript_12103:127-876(+)
MEEAQNSKDYHKRSRCHSSHSTQLHSLGNWVECDERQRNLCANLRDFGLHARNLLLVVRPTANTSGHLGTPRDTRSNMLPPPAVFPQLHDPHDDDDHRQLRHHQKLPEVRVRLPCDVLHVRLRVPHEAHHGDMRVMKLPHLVVHPLRDLLQPRHVHRHLPAPLLELRRLRQHRVQLHVQRMDILLGRRDLLRHLRQHRLRRVELAGRGARGVGVGGRGVEGGEQRLLDDFKVFGAGVVEVRLRGREEGR